LEQTESRGAAFIGNRVGNQSDCKSKNAANAQAGEEEAGAEPGEAAGKGAQTRANGVDEDGDAEDAGAAVAIAECAEDKSADGPADEKDRGSVGGEFGGARFVDDEFFDGAVAREIEKLLVETIE